MRKFSKILTVFLTVCLLAGIVTATVVSADETPTNASSESKEIVKYVNGLHRSGWISGFTATDMTTYYQYTGDVTAGSDSAYARWRGSNNATTVPSYDYVTWDLDFMADQYLDADGNLTTKAKDGVKLAYLSGLRIYHQNFAKAGHILYIIENNGQWYASADQDYDENKDIPLEKELGVWNHYTLVIDVNEKNVYMFINGQYLSSAATDSTQINKSDAQFNLRPHSSNAGGKFSVGIDKVYERGYNIIDNYTIDSDIDSIADYFGYDNDPNAVATAATNLPLYVCDDMAYNLKYKFDDVSNGQALASVNGNEHHVSLDAAIEELKGKSGEVTFSTRKTIEDFEIPEAIDTLTVVCTKGATFSYTGSYATTSPDPVEGDTKTYVIKKARFVDATWKDIDGETTKATEQVAVIVENNAVYIPDEIAEIYSSIKGIGRYEWALNDGGYEPFVPGAPLPDGVTKITVRPVTAMVTWQGDAEDVDETWFIGSALQKTEDMYANINGTENYEWSCDDGVTYTEFILGTVLPDGVTKITVRPVTATVTWKGIAGLSDADISEIWFKDSVLVAGDLTRFSSYEEPGFDGWYIIKYTAWAGFTAGMTVANDEYTFTPELNPVASLTDIKFNMSLLTKFEANLLISEAPSNVYITGVYSNADCVDNLFEALKSLELDGENYLVDSFFIDNSDVDKVFSRYVEYEVEYDGRKTVVIGEVEVSLLDYAEKVLAQYGCGSKEANLAYNLINYANAAYALKTGTDYEDAIAFLALEGHEDGCSCNATYNYAGEEVYYDFFYEEYVLGENVYAVSFDISNEQPAFVVYVMIDEFGNALADVKVEFNGIFGTEIGDIALNLVRGDDITIEGVGTFATLFFEDMPLYNATEIFTITATDATTGEVSVCNYSLATYIDFFYMMDVDASDRGLAVAEALYSFAKVAKDYKLN